MWGVIMKLYFGASDASSGSGADKPKGVLITSTVSVHAGDIAGFLDDSGYATSRLTSATMQILVQVGVEATNIGTLVRERDKWFLNTEGNNLSANVSDNLRQLLQVFFDRYVPKQVAYPSLGHQDNIEGRRTPLLDGSGPPF